MQCSFLLYALGGCNNGIEVIVNSFTNNLIAENRYGMILDGLQQTLVITLCAAVLGTISGGLACWCAWSKKEWLQQAAKVYIEIIHGTPVLVLLMLIYYVVMEPVNATGIVVAIITSGMNMSAYVSEMLRQKIGMAFQSFNLFGDKTVL